MASRLGLIIAATIFIAPVALQIAFSGRASSKQSEATKIRRQQLADLDEARRIRDMTEIISDETADQLLDCLKRSKGPAGEIERTAVKVCLAPRLVDFEDALHIDPASYE